MKIVRYVIISIVALVAILVGLLFLNSIVKQERLKAATAEQEMILREQEAFEQRRLEEQKAEEEANAILEYNGYGKLANKAKVRFLILADSEVGEDGRFTEKPLWLRTFERSLVEDGIEDTVFKSYPLRGGSILWGYILTQLAEEQAEYDFLIINVGEEDPSQVDIETFAIYYEKLVYDARLNYKDCEIISLMNVGDFMESKYSDVIQEVNNRYSAISIDVNGSDAEGIADKLNNMIRQNIEDNKVVTDEIPDSIRDVSILIETEVKVKPVVLDGFIREGDFYRNTSSTSFIEYETDKEYVFLTYLMYADGGKFNVYVDGELEHQIETTSEVTRNRTLMISTGEASKKSIRIEAINELQDEKYVVIYNLSTN